MKAGDKVRFPEEVWSVNGRDDDVLVKAGTKGTVVKVINDVTVYVQIPGCKVIASTWEVEVLEAA